MIDERSRLKRPGWPVERVLDWIDEACVLFDRRLDCVYANEPASALFGLTPDRLVGLSLHSQFQTAIASEFQRAALPAFANGTPARAALHDESTGRWLEAAMHPSSDGLLAIIADITSEKRTELERTARAEYLQQLVDQIPAFLWVIDRDLIVRRIEGGRPMLKALDRDRLIGLPQRVVTEMGCNAADTELSLEMHRRVLRGIPGRYRATWKGTTVTVRLPIAAPGVAPAVDKTERVERERGGRVLVVEDEAQVREVATRFLQRGGYDVLTASDAGTALDLLRSAGPFDVVLTDSAMPGMRGEDLAAEIAHVQPGLPVILMSGYADPGGPATSTVAAFIQKPFTMPVLLAEVRRAIAGDRPSD